MFKNLCRITSAEGDMIVMQRDSIIIAICLDCYEDLKIFEHYEYLEHSGLELADLENMYVIATFGEFRIIWMDA